MTEKRFNIEKYYDTLTIFVTDAFIENYILYIYCDTVDEYGVISVELENLVKVLNELNDDNQQLKAGILSQSEEIEILSEQNERLKIKLERERCSHQKQHEKWENEVLTENIVLRTEQMEEYKALLKQREVK